jgi:hypothetical protein
VWREKAGQERRKEEFILIPSKRKDPEMEGEQEGAAGDGEAG